MSITWVNKNHTAISGDTIDFIPLSDDGSSGAERAAIAIADGINFATCTGLDVSFNYTRNTSRPWDRPGDMGGAAVYVAFMFGQQSAAIAWPAESQGNSYPFYYSVWGTNHPALVCCLADNETYPLFIGGTDTQGVCRYDSLAPLPGASLAPGVFTGAVRLTVKLVKTPGDSTATLELYQDGVLTHSHLMPIVGVFDYSTGCIVLGAHNWLGPDVTFATLGNIAVNISSWASVEGTLAATDSPDSCRFDPPVPLDAVQQIYRATIKAWDPAINAEITLRYCTGTGYVTGADDAEPNIFFEPRILQPANMQRALVAGAATRGEADISYGDLTLVNNDGALDALANYGFDGRAILLELGTIGGSGAEHWITVIRGTMERADFSWTQLSIVLRDRRYELDKPLQQDFYNGSNVLPDGVDGTADDLRGQPKPRLYGWGLNLEPVCVNTSKLVYQISDRPVMRQTSIPHVDVYDAGVMLTYGTEYASLGELMQFAPSAGMVRVWPAGGLFRLGSAPSGQITCSALAGDDRLSRQASTLARQILRDAGVADGDIVSADVDYLTALGVAEVCGYVRPGETARQLLDRLLGAVGCWWGVDRFGRYRMGRLDAPSGVPVATLTAHEIVKIDRIANADGAIPPWQINLGFMPVETIQTSGLAGSVPAPWRAYVSAPYRRVSVDDASIKTLHPLSSPAIIDTAIAGGGDAQQEAYRLLALYGPRRDTLSVRVVVSPALLESIDLGAVVAVQLPRYGYNDGKLFCVLAIRSDLRGGVLDLTLWGPDSSQPQP